MDLILAFTASPLKTQKCYLFKSRIYVFFRMKIQQHEAQLKGVLYSNNFTIITFNSEVVLEYYMNV